MALDPSGSEGPAAPDRLRALAGLTRRLAAPLPVDDTRQAVAWMSGSTWNLDELLQGLVSRIRDGLDYAMVSIYVCTATGLHLRAHAGVHAAPRHVPLGQGVNGRVAQEGRAELARDVTREPDFRSAGDAMRHAVAVPLMTAGGEVLGTLSAATSGQPPLTEDDLGVLAGLADQIAVAVTRVRRHQETHRRRRQTHTLRAVTAALSRRRPLSHAVRRVARTMTRELGADAVGVYVADAARRVLVPFAGSRAPQDIVRRFLATPLSIESVPFLREAGRGRGPVWSADCVTDLRIDPELVRSFRLGSVVFAPSVVRGEVVGGLVVVWWGRGRTCAEEELRLIGRVATRLGLAARRVDTVRGDAVDEARFTVWLPFAAAVPDAPVSSPPATVPCTGHILVVDDEAPIRLMLTTMLRRDGHTVTTCVGGEEAVARLGLERFDLIITDLGMPGLSGWQVAEVARVRSPGTPVVLVTGWGDQLDPDEARTRGVDFLLAKPFESAELRDILARAFGRDERS